MTVSREIRCLNYAWNDSSFLSCMSATALHWAKKDALMMVIRNNPSWNLINESYSLPKLIAEGHEPRKRLVTVVYIETICFVYNNIGNLIFSGVIVIKRDTINAWITQGSYFEKIDSCNCIDQWAISVAFFWTVDCGVSKSRKWSDLVLRQKT